MLVCGAGARQRVAFFVRRSSCAQPFDLPSTRPAGEMTRWRRARVASRWPRVRTGVGTEGFNVRLSTRWTAG